MKCSWRVLTMAAVALFTMILMAGQVAGDHLIKQVYHSDAYEIMGQKQPATDDTTTIWLSDGKSSTRGSDNKEYIYIAGDKMLYLVDHNAKTYSEISSDPDAMLEQAKAEMDEEELAQYEMAQAMAEQMMPPMRLTVTPTQETKKIGDWNTTKYMVEMTVPMGKAISEMWVTDDVETDWESFQAMDYAKMAAMPGFKQILEEAKKIKGIPVYSITTTQMMGGELKSTVEILEFVTKDAPAGTFAVPEGYKKIDMMQMPMGQ